MPGNAFRLNRGEDSSGGVSGEVGGGDSGGSEDKGRLASSAAMRRWIRGWQRCPGDHFSSQ